MSVLLGVAPGLALLTVPALGRWSDSCTSKYGRRRPFIFCFSVVLVLSLALLYLGQQMQGGPARAVLLSAGVILLGLYLNHYEII